MSMFQKSAPAYAYPEPEYTEAPEHDEVETIVGPSMHVEGNFASEGNIIVKGIVSGGVHTSRHLSVEARAKIFANIKAGSATISGEVKGNVKVEGQLELTSTAQVVGDIECQVLAVEAGALLYGKVTMSGVEIEQATVRSAKRAASRRGKVAQEVDEIIAEEGEEIL